MLVFLTFGVSHCHSCVGFSHSYVWRLVFLRLGVDYFYVLGLVFFTFEGESLLRLGISYFYIWGLFILTFDA